MSRQNSETPRQKRRAIFVCDQYDSGIPSLHLPSLPVPVRGAARAQEQQVHAEGSREEACMQALRSLCGDEERGGREYQLILCDPPWDYDNRSTPYRGLPQKELCAMPVGRLANRKTGAFLCLWTTGPMMDRAIDAIRAWGFEYVTVLFVWCKTRDGCNIPRPCPGNYTMPSCEYLLLARTRRRYPKHAVADRTQKQLVFHPRLRHSEKPRRFHELLGEIFSTAVFRDRIELFARRTDVAGWDFWGLEIDGFLHFHNQGTREADESATETPSAASLSTREEGAAHALVE